MHWQHQHQSFGGAKGEEKIKLGAKKQTNINNIEYCYFCHFYTEINKFGLILTDFNEFRGGGKLGDQENILGH